MAKDLQQKWQFINCGGVLDAQHIRMMAPPVSEAAYYNYKNFHSIVLSALVGPNYMNFGLFMSEKPVDFRMEEYWKVQHFITNRNLES